MDGSQLPTEWTHLSKQSVPGVSDSKKRDTSLKQTGTASKKGPMAKNVDDGKMSKKSNNIETSKKVTGRFLEKCRK